MPTQLQSDLAALQSQYKQQLQALNQQYQQAVKATNDRATKQSLVQQHAVQLAGLKGWYSNQVAQLRAAAGGYTIPGSDVTSPGGPVTSPGSPAPVPIDPTTGYVSPPVPPGQSDAYDYPSAVAPSAYIDQAAGYDAQGNIADDAFEHPDVIYSSDRYSFNNMWPGMDLYNRSRLYPDTIINETPPTSMTASGEPIPASPEVLDAMSQRQSRQYSFDPYQNVWGTFGEQVVTTMPVRRWRRRHLSSIQRLNAMPVQDFGQWEALLGAAISGVSSVASAAISAELAPHPGTQKPANVTINQTSPTPTTATANQHLFLIIAGVVGVGAVVFMATKKRRRK